jgi:hypothetical protein
MIPRECRYPTAEATCEPDRHNKELVAKQVNGRVPRQYATLDSFDYQEHRCLLAQATHSGTLYLSKQLRNARMAIVINCVKMCQQLTPTQMFHHHYLQ